MIPWGRHWQGLERVPHTAESAHHAADCRNGHPWSSVVAAVRDWAEGGGMEPLHELFGGVFLPPDRPDFQTCQLGQGEESHLDRKR